MTAARNGDREVMAGFPPPPESRVRLADVYSAPAVTAWFMQHAREVAPTANIAAGRAAVPELPRDLENLDDVIVDDAQGGTWSVAQMLTETATDGFLLLHNGRVRYERTFGGFAVCTPHLCHSISKSIASCVAANLAERGVIDPDERITAYVPELVGSAYGHATVRHLLDMTVGIQYVENHEDDDSEDARLDRLCGLKPRRVSDEPGSIYDFATTTAKAGEHGRVLHYVSLNTDVLGWVMERAAGAPVAQLILREVWSKLGGEDDAYIILDGAGSAVLDGGVCASLRDLARFGQMLVQRGTYGGQQIVPSWWIDDVRANGDQEAFAAAPDCVDLPRGWSYRSCFWVGAGPESTPILALGMYGQLVFVDCEKNVVAVKLSRQARPTDDALVTRTYRALTSLSHLLTSG